MWNRYVRLAEEAQHGTPAANGVFVDPESASLDAPDDQALVWPSASGVDRQLAAGPYVTEGDIKVPLDDDVAGYLFKWLLGRYSTVGTAVGGGGNTTLSQAVAAGANVLNVLSVANIAANDHVQIGTGAAAEVHQVNAVDGGANTITLATPLRFGHAVAEAVVEVTAPYTHQFTRGDNQVMIPFTCGIGKELFEHTFSGCVLNQVEIEVGEDIVALTAGIMASRDSKSALANVAAFNEGEIFAPHDVTASIAGVDESAKVEGLTLTINHNADLEAGRGIGSRHPRRGYRGQLVVEGELSLAFVDTEELERFWGTATGPSADTLTEFSLDLNFGAGLDISMPRVVYTGSKQPVGGQGRIEQTIPFRGFFDPVTGTGPVLITLTNDRPRY